MSSGRNSDTEAIVHAYEEWGVAGLARLNGMYGIALWDADRRALVDSARPLRHQAAVPLG